MDRFLNIMQNVSIAVLVLWTVLFVLAANGFIPAGAVGLHSIGMVEGVHMLEMSFGAFMDFWF